MNSLGGLKMSNRWSFHVTTHKSSCIENIGPCARQISQTSNKTLEECRIHLFCFIIFEKFNFTLDRCTDRLAIVHLEFLQYLFRIAFLGDKDAFFFLLDFDAEIICHEPNISHFEFSRHCILEFFEHAGIV